MLIVDFGTQARLPRWFKRALRSWLAQFSVEPRDVFAVELARIARRPGSPSGTRSSTAAMRCMR